jgi:hypothetical protein
MSVSSMPKARVGISATTPARAPQPRVDDGRSNLVHARLRLALGREGCRKKNLGCDPVTIDAERVWRERWEPGEAARGSSSFAPRL